MKNSNPWKFRLAYFLHEYNSASLWAYITIILAGFGLNEAEIGIYNAIACIPSIFFNTFGGYLCDRFHSVKKIYIPFYIIEAIAAALVFWLDVKVWVLIFLTVTSTMVIATITILDTWTLQSNEDNKKKFPLIFICNPAGYATGALITGLLSDKFGFSMVVPLTYIGIGIVMVTVMGLGVKDIAVKRESDDLIQKQETGLKDILAVLKDKRFILITALMTLVLTCDYIESFYAPLKIIEIGGTDTQVGLYYSIPLYTQVAMYFVVQKVVDRINKSSIFLSSALIIVSAVIVTARILLIGFAPNVIWIQVIAMMSLLIAPILFTVPKMLLVTIAPPHLQNTYPISSMGIYMNVSQIMAALLGGYWLMKYGYRYAFYYGSIFGVLGLCLAITLFVVLNKRKTASIIRS